METETNLKSNVLVILIIGVIYFISGKLGLALAIPGTNVTPVWPPSGVALAAVLLFGSRTLWSVFLGSWILNITAVRAIHATLGWEQTILVSAFIGIGATLQAALGAFLIQEYIQTRPYHSRTTAIIKFLCFALISCLVNSTVGSLSITLEGITTWEEFPRVWWTWWVGDSAGVFVITPLIFAWILHPLTHWTWQKVVEASFIILLIILTAYLNLQDLPIAPFLFLPWVIWALIRFQLPGATLALFITVLLVVLETIHGRGAFVRDSLNESLVYLGLFIMVKTTITLILSAKLSRRTASIFVWHGSSDTILSLLDRVKESFNQNIEKW